MQIYYATHLPLPSRGGGQELDTTIAALGRWIRRRFGVELRPLAEGHATGRGASVYWTMLSGTAGGLFGVWTDQPDTNDDAWRWRTYVDVGVQDQQAWFRVRVHLYSNMEGLLANPRVLAGRPGVVRELVDELEIELDGLRLGRHMHVDATNVGHYLALLENRDRRLPVVALSLSEDGETFVDAEETADKLLGLAHVAVVDDAAAWTVTEAIGKALSCYRGSVRIYWPRMKSTDDPLYHRLFAAGALDFLGRAGLQQEIFLTLGRLSGLTVDEPSLRKALLLEAREAALEKSVDDRAAALARITDAADEGAVPADEFAQFAAAYDELDAKYAMLDLDAVEVQREVERVRRERDDARAGLVELSRSLAKNGDEGTSDTATPPDTVLEAVQQAQLRARHSVILDEALESASESQYGDASRVLEDLQLIEQIARDWANGELAEGPHLAFRQRCSAYRDGIGKKAGTKYGSDYRRAWKNESIILGPHIARGVGPILKILRIYMYFDTDSKQIVIGHIGRKLRDDSNRN